MPTHFSPIHFVAAFKAVVPPGVSPCSDAPVHHNAMLRLTSAFCCSALRFHWPLVLIPCLPTLPRLTPLHVVITQFVFLQALGNWVGLLPCGHLHLFLYRLGDLDDGAVRARGQTRKRDGVTREDTRTGEQCD